MLQPVHGVVIVAIVLYTMAVVVVVVVFFFNDTATTEIYTLSLHDALPISKGPTVTLYLP